jgi:hypothetical protein
MGVDYHPPAFLEKQVEAVPKGLQDSARGFNPGEQVRIMSSP